jgi:hypothetical protein
MTAVQQQGGTSLLLCILFSCHGKNSVLMVLKEQVQLM